MTTVFVVGARGVPDVEGGAEKNAEMIFPLIVAAGHRVVLVGLADNIKAPTFKGVELLKAPRSRLLKTDKLLYYIAAIFMALKVKPDVVHFQGLGSALFLWAYRLMGVKTVVRYGSADYLVDKWGLLGRLGFLAAEYQLRHADAVISVTPALAHRLAERGIKHNVHVIPNAVDVKSAPDGEGITLPAQPYVLTVGRVTAQKNVANLIRGFEAFAAKDQSGAILAVAGGLDEVDYVESLKPLLTERTLLMDRQKRSHMGPLYAGSAVYVNSSMHEGSSNAVLEAISWGAPILLSDIPENRDFGIETHHYFDPLDPEAIGAAIGRAVADPATYRVDLSRFLTWNNVAEKTMAIYGTILAKASPAAQAGAAPSMVEP
jgi:glycosyltransferase involved in cell wall biosynthesis